MKIIFAIFSLIILPFNLRSQVILNGNVSNSKNGESVPGAIIYFPELEKGCYSDKDGGFRIGNLPAINVLVQVSCVGFKSIIENIDLSTSNSINFKMTEAVTEMNEVIVTGTSRATEITRNPIPVITLNIKALNENSSSNIIDALSKSPGVNVLSTGPNVSKPFIHGLGYNRVLTLYDGVRQEGQQWGDEHGVEVDENAVDHIEIVKGPASLSYGSDAIAGVVNLLPAPHVPNDTILGRIESTYGTNNRLLSTSASLAGNRDGFVWGGIASHKQAIDYMNRYDGRVYNTAFNETDLSGYIGVNKHWGVSDIHFSFFNDLQEIPDGSRDSVTRKFTRQITEADTARPVVPEKELESYKIGAIHQHVQFLRLYTSNNLIVGQSRLNILMGFQQSIRREYSHPQNTEIPGLYLDLKTFTYDVKFTLPEHDGWNATAGINGMLQFNSVKGTEFVIPDYNLFDLGPFVLISKKFKHLNISTGIRFDEREFRNSGLLVRTDPKTGFDSRTELNDTLSANRIFYPFSAIFSGLSASLGATYSLTERLLLKANIARGYRSPNIAEISANGVHPGTLIYQIGNKELKPEFSVQEDIELSYRSDKVSGYIDVFNNNISNYIFNMRLLNQSGQDSVVVKGNQTFKFQQVAAELSGGEAYLDIHPVDWLHIENSVSLVTAVNKGGKGVTVTYESKYLPLIPPLHYISELRAEINRKIGIIRPEFLKFGIEIYGRQNRVYSENNTETPTPGYLLLSAGIGSSIYSEKGKKLMTFMILCNNLTDKTYQSHLSRLKYLEEFPVNKSGKQGIYNMGRNISFRLSIPLDFCYRRSGGSF
jgi:iron complex outermembrane recepter protein